MSDADHRRASTHYAAAGHQPAQSSVISTHNRQLTNLTSCSRQTIKPNPGQPSDHEPHFSQPPTHRPIAVLDAYLMIGRNGADTSTECLSPITVGSLMILSTTAFLSFICEASPQMIV